jgi:hypothetical protein
MEAVRNGLIALRPTRPPPYIIPAGRALVALKAAIEAGDAPGFARDSFFASLYEDEAHLNANGSYLVTLVFYACMFQRSPLGLPHAGTTLTDDQAALFQRIAWETVSNYALSGIGR